MMIVMIVFVCVFSGASRLCLVSAGHARGGQQMEYGDVIVWSSRCVNIYVRKQKVNIVFFG